MNNDEKLKGIVGGILGVSPAEIGDDFSAADADSWDSLNHINLMAAVEEEFGITISTDKIESSRSIAELKTLLHEHGIDC